MAKIPAFCYNCATIFSSGIEATNVKRLTLKGNKSRCPNCGTMAPIPDGVYNAIGDTLELIAGPDRTVKDLETLKEIFEDARRRQVSREEFATRLERDAPHLSGILSHLPVSEAAFWAALTFLVTTVNSLYNNCAGRPPSTNIDLDVDYYEFVVDSVSTSIEGPIQRDDNSGAAKRE